MRGWPPWTVPVVAQGVVVDLGLGRHGHPVERPLAERIGTARHQPDGAGGHARFEQRGGQGPVGLRPGRVGGVLQDRLATGRGLGEPDGLAHRRLQHR